MKILFKDFDSISFDETISNSDDDLDLQNRSRQNSLDKCQQIGSCLSQSIFIVDANEQQIDFIRYLRWKTIALVNECNKQTTHLIERMNSTMNSEINNYPDEPTMLQNILAGLADAIPFHVKNLITFSRQTPALNEIDMEDFNKIINNRLFDYWLIKHSPLLRQNQSYIMLPNGLQYTRQWMTKILGKEIVDTIFDFAEKLNELHLTSEEYALIFPVIICFEDETLNDQETVRNIQNCYLNALYTQMLATRTHSEARNVFINLIQILSILPMLNELQAKRIPDDTNLDL